MTRRKELKENIMIQPPPVKANAPCREACPAGVDVPRYIRHIREGDFERAHSVIRERIPFPAVCGFACTHPCESQCSRRQFDDPLAIRMLKRAAFEYGGVTGSSVTGIPRPTGKKVAVIGSGPCGLTTAYYLAGKGHRVTVFEALPCPGGMLRYGIPGYRLPKDVLDREIETVTQKGVDIKTGIRVESASRLLDEGFDAVFAATGAWQGIKTRLVFDGTVSVLDGVPFLQEVNSGSPPATGEKVLVVGGGNSAIDTARTAVRLGAREVTVVYRRAREDMPAAPEEVEGALEEGVKMVFQAAPVEIRDGQVICLKMAPGEPDQSGRPRPVPVAGSEFSIKCDTLIMAIGQSAGAALISLEGNADGTIKADPHTLATSLKGVFAGGDAVTGPSSIIQSIAQGRLAAASVDLFLGGDGIIDTNPAAAEGVPPLEAPRGSLRPVIRTLPPNERRSGFATVEMGFDPETAAGEARRCLSCDMRDYKVEVNFFACKECGYCREVCGAGVFDPSGSFNQAGYKPMTAARTEKCVGCLMCLMICPDFAITVEKTSTTTA
ncbi:MAG: FAD-dependent oxidoreductase [Bacillota bacterium]